MAERSLVDFVSEVKGESHLRIEQDFGGGFVRLHTSEAEKRQAAQDIRNSEDIVLELLRNAKDAHASHVFVAVSKDANKRIITVIDDGDGIPETMHENIFMSRVTSKLDTSHKDAWGYHGRGMALFSISENALEAHVIASGTDLGTSLGVVTDTSCLPEKKDQSSFPRFLLDAEGTVCVRGPKNIIRTSCEFAIESRNDCSVYIGSQAEIAAALYAYGQMSLSAFDRAFCKDVNSLQLVKRLAVCADANDLAAQSCALGLNISARTAQRILNGEIEEAVPLLDLIVIEQGDAVRKTKRKARNRSVKVQKSDVAELAESTKRAFNKIAETYYLEQDVEPTVRVGRDKITVSIPLVEKEEPL